MSKPAKDVRSSISEMIAFSTSSKIAFGVKKYRVVFAKGICATLLPMPHPLSGLILEFLLTEIHLQGAEVNLKHTNICLIFF